MPPSPRISLLPPPGPSVLKIHFQPSLLSESTVPSLFLDASAIRFAVFVVGQHCPAAEEIDADDPCSWHWVAFAASRERDGGGVADTADLGDEKESVAAATIRLVPVSSAAPDGDDGIVTHIEGPSHNPTQMWDGHEPYIKLGRLATLSAYRGLGLGRLLINTALEWAVENSAVLKSTDDLTSGDKKREKGEEQPTGEDEENTNGDGKGNGWNGLVLVHAQTEVEPFYRRLGFMTDEGMGRWYEGGIEHLAMWRRLELS